VSATQELELAYLAYREAFFGFAARGRVVEGVFTPDEAAKMTDLVLRGQSLIQDHLSWTNFSEEAKKQRAQDLDSLANEMRDFGQGFFTRILKQGE